jgi:5-methyltetrahydropteroyltriglutamate--homocysteine methyltransferase
MKMSTERILTTHVGSLARPPDLFDMLAARASGQPYDAAAFDARVRQAVADVVRRQAELGIDIINDGEQGKPGLGVPGVLRTVGAPAGSGDSGTTAAHRLHRSDNL